MKEITLYMDVYPGQNDFYATTLPGNKITGQRRYSITVRVPDPNGPDATLPVHETKEVDKEQFYNMGNDLPIERSESGQSEVKQAWSIDWLGFKPALDAKRP